MSVSRRQFLISTGSAGLAGVTSFALSGPVSAQTEAVLFEAARKEGRLSLYYVPFTQEIINEIGEAFSKKYPGIRVEGTRKVAGALFQQLTQERQANIRNCDVFCTTDIGQMLQLRDLRNLTPFTPATISAARDEFQRLDPQNMYQVGAIIPLVIGYNTQRVRPDQLPKTYQDLLSERFKNQLSTGSGLASGQVAVWVLAMQQKYGGFEKYFRAFNNLNPRLRRSINDVVADIVSGESALGVAPLGQMLAAKARGNPVDVVYPEDGTVIVVSPAGILANAPNPNAAKLYMNFLFSKEYGELVAKFFEQPLRDDVRVSGTRSISDMKPIILEAEEIRKGVTEVQRNWRSLFGA